MAIVSMLVFAPDLPLKNDAALVSPIRMDVKGVLHGWHVGFLPPPSACPVVDHPLPIQVEGSVPGCLTPPHISIPAPPLDSTRISSHHTLSLLPFPWVSTTTITCRLGLVLHGPPDVIQTFPTGGNLAASSEKKLPSGPSPRAVRSSPLPNGSFSSAARAPRAPLGRWIVRSLIPPLNHVPQRIFEPASDRPGSPLSSASN